MDLPIVAAALLLPWILGSTMLGALRSPSRAPDAPGEIAWLAGAGWFVGAFALTLWMRALSLAGVRFGLAAVALPLLAVALALAALTWRRDGAPRRRGQVRGVPRAGGEPRARRRRARLLVGGDRVAGAALRAARARGRRGGRSIRGTRGSQWATKARVWYELGDGAVRPQRGVVRRERHSSSSTPRPNYPATVPLWQVWIEPRCSAAGTTR